MPPFNPAHPLLITPFLTSSPSLLVLDISNQHVLCHSPFGFNMKLEQLFQFPRFSVLLLCFINVPSQRGDMLFKLDSAVVDLVDLLAEAADESPSR